jgi:murein endopeptidase
LLCTIQPVFAHDNHVHVTDQSVLPIAKEAVAQLTTKDQGLGFGKLSASWNDVPLKNAKVHKKYPGYYVVAVTNDKEKKTIYFVISEDGDVYDANFTGEFKSLK